MKRRQLLTLPMALALGLGLAGCAGWPGAGGPPSFKVSAEQLQQAMARRFPRRYPVLGLFELHAQTPRLRLLPELNRLGVELVLDLSGPALGRSYTGAFDLDFALRYEASDQTVRAHQLRVNALRFSGLPTHQSELLSAYGPGLAEQSLHEVVLHRLSPQDLGMADRLGLQPGSITVTPEGLVITFVAKPPPGERR